MNKGVISAWSVQEDALLHKLYFVQGVSAGLCTESFPGRSRNSIIGRANRLGFVRNPAMQLANSQAASRARGPREPVEPRPRLQQYKERPRTIGEPVESPNAGPWIARKARQCAFPVGDETGADQWSCCNPTEPGKSYCPGHAEIMFNGTPKPNTAFAASKPRRSPSFKEWAA